jgi:hypothetical protein
MARLPSVNASDCAAQTSGRADEAHESPRRRGQADVDRETAETEQGRNYDQS